MAIIDFKAELERQIGIAERIAELEAEVERLRQHGLDYEGLVGNIEALGCPEGMGIVDWVAELVAERKEMERLREQLHLANVDQCNTEAELAAERAKKEKEK